MHRGEFVKLAVVRSGISFGYLADKLKIHRNSLLNWWEKEDLSIDKIIKIGQIIKHDFSKEIPEINELLYVEEPISTFNKIKPVGISSVEECMSKLEHWKEKYYNLLEQNNQLIRKIAGLE
jgi:predicted transcriptional regulator